jgi:hypothetical protein
MKVLGLLSPIAVRWVENEVILPTAETAKGAYPLFMAFIALLPPVGSDGRRFLAKFSFHPQQRLRGHAPQRYRAMTDTRGWSRLLKTFTVPS